MIPNLLWTIIHLTPLVIYCYKEMEPLRIYVTLGLSCLTAFLPQFFYNKLQLSPSTAIYKKIGIGWVRRFSQDGDVINKWARKKYPGYKVIPRDREKYLMRIAVNERFHFAALVFFLFTTIHTLLKMHIGWCFLFIFSNVLYNVYPMLLQQYNRLRIQHLSQRKR